MRRLWRKAALSALSIVLSAAALFPQLTAGAIDDRHEREAEALHQLGLYNGISNRLFNPDLDGKPTRETAILFLSRLFGHKVQQLSSEKTDRLLGSYRDHADIYSGARAHFAYAIQEGLVKGESASRLGPKSPISLEQYSTLVLRYLGFDPVYGKAVEQLIERGILTKQEASGWGKASFDKAAMIGIAYQVLTAQNSKNVKVINMLVELGAVNSETARKLGIWTPETETEQVHGTPTSSPNPTPAPSSSPSSSPSPSPSPSPEPEPAEQPKNYAPWATASTGFGSKTPITMLNDGNDESVWSSNVTPEFPNWIVLDLGELAITTSQISVITWFAQGQGITDIDVDYWADGQWKTVLQHVSLDWQTNDVTKEAKPIELPDIVTSKIRLTVHAANTIWGNVAINDIQWWGVEPPPAVVNVAPEGEFTVAGVADSAGIDRLNDGNEQNVWVGVRNGQTPVYLNLDMGENRAHVDKLTIISSDISNQGIREIDMEYFNGDRWVTLKRNEPLSWIPATSGTDQAEVAFDPVSTHKIRIKINQVAAADHSFAIHEIKVWGYTNRPPELQSNANAAVGAAISSDLSGIPGQSLTALNDGDLTTSWASATDQSFPGKITLTFDREITTNKISLIASNGRTSGVANVTVDYLNGSVWETAAANVSMTWNSDTETVEYGDIRFSAITTSTIRIQVNAGYSTQGQIGLHEIKVWEAQRTMPQEPPLPPMPPLPEPEIPSVEPEPVNVAGTATVSTTIPLRDGYAIDLINNGSMESAWSSGVGVTFPGTITLDWGNQAIKTDKMTIYTWYGQGQGITNVDVEYDVDGAWVTAAANQSLTWTTNDGTIEALDIVYPSIETSKIRLVVRDANVSWGNIGINEMKVWSKS